MQNLIKKSLFTILLGLIGFFGQVNLTLAVDSSCQGKTCAVEGLNDSASKAGLKVDAADADATGYLSTRVGSLIGIILAFTGTIFFLLTIYGGFLWMTAQGDSAQVKKGKDIIINAALGLVVVFSAYAITTFVGENVSK